MVTLYSLKSRYNEIFQMKHVTELDKHSDSVRTGQA